MTELEGIIKDRSGIKNFKCSVLEARYFGHENGTHLDKLHVYKNKRNKGYGTAYMKQFIEQNSKPITVMVLNEIALKFYLKLGFRVEREFVFEGVLTRADLIYTKELL